MPIIKSAKRAIRQSERRHVYNLRRARAMQAAVREVKEVAKSGKAKDIKDAERAAYKAIDKAMKRGIIKKNAAARKKSQVAKLLSPKK